MISASYHHQLLVLELYHYDLDEMNESQDKDPKMEIIVVVVMMMMMMMMMMIVIMMMMFILIEPVMSR